MIGEWLTTKEFMSRTHYNSTQTVAEAVRSGIIKRASKRGRGWLIHVDEVEVAADRLKVAGATNANSSTNLEAPAISGSLGDVPGEEPVDIWERLERHQKRQKDVRKHRDAARVEFDGRGPVAITFLADLHIGNPDSDYRAIREEAETIGTTDRMYAVSCGDLWDNWVVPALAHLQRKQVIPHGAEWLLVKDWLAKLGESLVVVVGGNHDGRSMLMAGVDPIKEHLGLTNSRLIYDSDQVRFRLIHGDVDLMVKVRHKWQGRSMWNATHGIERDLRMNDPDWDLAVGGHTHAQCVVREFAHAGKKHAAVQLGTYKQDDSFGRRLGLNLMQGSGSMTLVLWPDGRHIWTEYLDIAKQLVS